MSPVDKALNETGTTVGVSWSALGTTEASGSNGFTGGQQDQTNGLGSGKANVNVIDFTKTLKNYSLERAVVESPRINVEDLRYAAHRTEQLRAIMDLLKESVRNSWEDRYRAEYAKICDNVVICKASGTAPATGKEGSDTPASAGDVDVDNNNSAELIAANVSNKVLDDLYFKLVRAGAGFNAYGRENGRPVFSLVCSSEASYQIMTESESIKDDIRYNNSRVSELIAPLGVEKSFRGYYHLIDDLAPRYSDTVDGSDNLVRVQPYIHNTSTDKIEINPDYDTAPIEEAFILVDNVMESLIPAPITGANGLSFDPVNYKGEFKWTNIPDQTLNPDGTIGFFRGIMASASKPIKTNFGYSILFRRTSTTLAA